MSFLLGHLVFALGHVLGEGHGPVFLGSSGASASLEVSSGATDLLEDLERGLGSDRRLAIESRMRPLEEVLRPMFNAMPKDSVGNVGLDAVRYVLHRLFVQRRGWRVKGLDTNGEAWNSASPIRMLGEHMNLFEGHLAANSLDLQQVAILGATFESLVHDETLDRLRAAYKFLGLSEHQEHLSEDEAEGAIDTYMLMYVLGMEHSSPTRGEIDEAYHTVLDVYPNWPQTKAFSHELRESVLADTPAASRTSWQSAIDVVVEIEKRYGHYQNKDCRQLKTSLLELEAPGTGRVQLRDFYRSALTNSTWQFLESVPYLRQLGALDGVDGSVVIPNYIKSPSNCLAGSRFYSVCCIDECDPLLSHLEHTLAAADATPADIAELVAALPSETVEAPRSLPASMLQRLEEIAAHHGGRVPLHSHLFAQWMHRAYPHECPYPHLSGTTRPQTPIEWMEETGEDVTASETEMRRFLQETSRQDRVSSDELTAWSTEEELFVVQPSLQQGPARQSGGLRMGLMLLTASGSMAVGAMHVFSKVSGMVTDSPPQKYSF